MKRCLYLIICIFVSYPLIAFRGKPLLLPRSQSVNAARELVGWQEILDLIIIGEQRTAFSVTPAYDRSFKPCKITNYLFGANNLVFSGSRVENRCCCDILADYFGLPTDFKSTLFFKPHVSTFLVDFDVYASLNYGMHHNRKRRGPCCNWDEGLFIRVHAPLVHTKWDLDVCEQVNQVGTLDYPAGYMSNTLITRGELPLNAENALSGYRTFGDMQAPLQFGKLNCGTQSKTLLSDIQCAFGYNFCVKDDRHVGIALRVAIPTGNTPNPTFLFEPIIGNGHHWELGGMLTSHYIFCESEDGCRAGGVYMDLNITHLFGKKQLRSFDLRHNGRGSRYMLLEEIGNVVVQGVTVGGTAIEQEYHAQLLPAINKTTLVANIDIAMQLDFVVKLSYMHANWQADLGYNLWIRSKERLQCRETFPSNVYGIKGDAQLYGFRVGLPQYVGINATQSGATLNAGQGFGNANKNFVNANADNPAIAQLSGNTLLQTNVASLVDTGVSALDLVNGSDQAILLTDHDIDNCSALICKTSSNKVFAHIGYRWMEEEAQCVIPFLGIGAEAEFADRNIIHSGTLSQWGVWLKGGFSY